MSCFVIIVWPYPGIFLVSLLSPAFKKIFLINCCQTYLQFFLDIIIFIIIIIIMKNCFPHLIRLVL